MPRKKPRTLRKAFIACRHDGAMTLSPGHAASLFLAHFLAERRELLRSRRRFLFSTQQGCFGRAISIAKFICFAADT